MTTLIHVNESEEVPLTTGAAVLNYFYPPPHPEQNDDVDTRYESEEVPLKTNAVLKSLLPHHPRTRRRLYTLTIRRRYL